MNDSRKTMKIAPNIHKRLKSEMGFETFDELFSTLLNFKNMYKKEWEEFIKQKNE